MSDVSATVIKFSSNKDEKASMAPMYLSLNGTVFIKSFSTLNCEFMPSNSSQIMINQFLYYNGPSPPAGLFDDCLAIPSLSRKIHEGSFADFINSIGGSAGFR
jgi:hypothetical protein